MGFSQQFLAGGVGLTFQQVQKYERGTNRISASKLYELARFLRYPISAFFIGLDDGVVGAGFDLSDSETSVQAFLSTAEGIEIARAFPRIQSGRVKRRVLNLVRSLADD